MKAASVMVVAALAAWLAIAVWGDERLRFDAAVAMAGPLIVAVTTWLWMERAFERARQSFTGHMTAAFGFTAVFFAAYVTAALVLTSVRSVPFAVAFTASFIALHGLEGFFLWRMLKNSTADA